MPIGVRPLSSIDASLATERNPLRRAKGVEWPTVALAAGIYGSWLAVSATHAWLGYWISAPALALLVAWHSSLQHEIIHGHPTRSRWLNAAIGFWPLSLWLPFECYRQSHLRHHRDERLTDPFDDPESYYWSAESWHALGPLGRSLVRVQTTLGGRIVIGPLWTVQCFLRREAALLLRGEPRAARIWALHGAGVAALVVWLEFVCGMSVWSYLLLAVYPGTAILLIRSFAEHRACKGVAERTAIVENARLLGPLYLFNNLHAAHHDRPALPWYRLAEFYRRDRDRLIAENGGLVYDGYLDVAGRYLLRPHDGAVHPFACRASERGTAPEPAG
jgi:fatty acid desaturase